MVFIIAVKAFPDVSRPEAGPFPREIPLHDRKRFHSFRW